MTIEYLIRKSECQRLHVIFNDIIPAMKNSLATKDVVNIKEVLDISLPNLRKRAFKLAEKCRKDDGCNSECQHCTPDFIYNNFKQIIN